MSFSLKRQTAKIAHLNVREEKHGEESVVAVDVKVQADIGNDFLEALALGLRAALYSVDGAQLEGVEQAYSVLRFAAMKPLDWEAPMTACEFVVHGAKRADDMEFTGEIAKPLVLAPKEGGTVSVTLQVQIHPDAHDLGALSAFLGRSTKVSLRPLAEVEASGAGAGNA